MPSKMPVGRPALGLHPHSPGDDLSYPHLQYRVGPEGQEGAPILPVPATVTLST